ncbi:hypothetical protein DRH29_04780 [candidate division Kazan bacterium]|uniref:Uncharacterized protein n=1 Tax=candidate division Kazan bacterium TaxID=2202143 RepID=A0A420ZBL7_UNCK3|nr:MAG: hypothetical protein DRH29_04780 [candidate division Kazan bacterium]
MRQLEITQTESKQTGKKLFLFFTGSMLATFFLLNAFLSTIYEELLLEDYIVSLLLSIMISAAIVIFSKPYHAKTCIATVALNESKYCFLKLLGGILLISVIIYQTINGNPMLTEETIKYPAISWSKISVANIFSASLIIYSLLILPGSSLSTYLFKEKEFSMPEKIVISFTLSFIILAILGMLYYLFHFACTGILIITVIILLFTIFQNIRTASKGRRRQVIKITEDNILFVIVLATVFTMTVFSLIDHMYFLREDNWIIVGFVVQALKGGDVIATSLEFRYPIFYAFPLLTLVMTASLPPLNVYTITYLLVAILHVLSVYALFMSFTKDSSLSCAATILYFLGGGFVWIALILFPKLLFPKKYWLASYITLDGIYGDYYTVTSWWVYKSTALIFPYTAILLLIKYIDIKAQDSIRQELLKIRIKYISLAALFMVISLLIHMYEYLLLPIGIMVLSLKSKEGNFQAFSTDSLWFIVSNIVILSFLDLFIFKLSITELAFMKISVIMEFLPVSTLMPVEKLFLIIIAFFLMYSTPSLVLKAMNVAGYLREKLSGYWIYLDLLIFDALIFLLIRWILNPYPQTNLLKLWQFIDPKYLVTKWGVPLFIFSLGIPYLMLSNNTKVTKEMKSAVMLSLSWFLILFPVAYTIWFHRLLILLRASLFLCTTIIISFALTDKNINLKNKRGLWRDAISCIIIFIIVITSTLSSSFFFTVSRHTNKSYDIENVIDMVNWLSARLNEEKNITILTTPDGITYHAVRWLLGESNVIPSNKLIPMDNLTKSMLIDTILENKIKYFVVNRQARLRMVEKYIISFSILQYSNEEFMIYEIIIRGETRI